VFNINDATAMALVGADVIVAHLGLTTKRSIGASTALSLEEAPGKVKEICEAALCINPDIICLCHGGPIAEPSDAEYVLKNTKGIHGFYGVSSMERLPTEIAIRQQAEKFKSIKFKR
jgi:predicted TIM-barrel enzyme